MLKLKKNLCIVFTIAIMATTITGCYNDDDIWELVNDLTDRVTNIEKRIEAMNDDMVRIKALVEALSEGAVVTGCEATDGGYLLTFSDGKSVIISNGRDRKDGKDGRDGKDGIIVGIAMDSDGIYYWTITRNSATDWLLDSEGNKIPVSGKDGINGSDGKDGKDGNDGKDGLTPRLGVDNGYWTVDYGDGKGPVFLRDENGNKIPIGETTATVEGLFSSVTPGDDEIVFILVDGSTFSVPRIDNFGIEIDTSDPYFDLGETRKYPLKLNGVVDFYITNVTKGWEAALSGNELTVTAPDAVNENNIDCDIRLIAVNRRHDCRAFKISVKIRMMGDRVLTFEDADYMGSGSYLGKKDWSSLIDSQQYGGPLLYPATAEKVYNWYDEANTGLASDLPNNYGDGKFWGGGQAISNYVDTNLSNGDFNHQLSVYYRHSNGKGGHNGSSNFCIQNGYFDTDPDGLAQNRNIPNMYFKGGEACLIKGMWVTNTTYFLNEWKNGNSLSPAASASSYFKIVAYAYGPDGKLLDSHPSLTLAEGKNNIATSWKWFDLSSLGKVTAIAFNIESNVGNEFGMSVPAYFALDDITVYRQIY